MISREADLKDDKKYFFTEQLCVSDLWVSLRPCAPPAGLENPSESSLICCLGLNKKEQTKYRKSTGEFRGVSACVSLCIVRVGLTAAVHDGW